MLIGIQYLKNMSNGKKRYEISSKIVHREDYMKDEDCIGEIDGEYFLTINVKLPYLSVIKRYYKTLLKERIKRKILSLVSRSKKLVSEWELNNEIMNEAEKYIESYIIK